MKVNVGGMDVYLHGMLKFEDGVYGGVEFFVNGGME